VATTKLIPIQTLGTEFFVREKMGCIYWDRNIFLTKSDIDSLKLISLLKNYRPFSSEASKALGFIFGSSYQYGMNLDSKSIEIQKKL